jgi:hypothetical protein
LDLFGLPGEEGIAAMGLDNYDVGWELDGSILDGVITDDYISYFSSCNDVFDA